VLWTALSFGLGVGVAAGFYDSLSKAWPGTAAQVLAGLLVAVVLSHRALDFTAEPKARLPAFLIVAWALGALLISSIGAAEDRSLGGPPNGLVLGSILGLSGILLYGLFTRSDEERRGGPTQPTARPPDPAALERGSGEGQDVAPTGSPSDSSE
jgi:hypothetical protein